MNMNEVISLNESSTTLIPKLLRRLDVLESQGVMIQAQPLGFMRLALEGQKNNQEGLFLHVWVPGLPVQEGGPFMHTHVFDLESRIIKGAIQDTTFTPEPNPAGTFQLIGAVCAEDYCAPFDAGLGLVSMEKERVLDLKEGDIYTVPKNSFHSTTLLGDIAVTLIRKYNVEDKDPILAVPVGIKVPEDTFRRDQLDQVSAWKIIRSLLN